MIRRILEKIEGISRKVDNKGWTPLHLDAYLNHSYLTKSSFAKLLLDNDRHVAYMKDKEGRTALHIAAQCGNAEVMSDIVLRCPDCCELVDKRGWNVLHFAMKGSKYNLEDTIKIIIENSSLSNLLNEKNADGDTPLQYYSKSMMNVKSFICHPRVDKMVFNKQNFSAYDIALTNDELPEEKMSQIKKAIHPRPPRRVITFEDEDKKDNDEDKEKEDQRSLLQKAAEAHLVVAALITTVTFAACITMPGGFAGGGEGSHPGSALLRRNAAFKAFVIMDTISMAFSSTAVILHLIMPALVKKNYDAKKREEILRQTLIYIYDAMIAMVLAFVTGTYAVLEPSFGLAITNLIIGLTFFFCLHFGFDETSVLDYLPIFPPSSTPEEEY